MSQEYVNSMFDVALGTDGKSRERQGELVNAELDRLREVNEKLVEALNQTKSALMGRSVIQMDRAIRSANAALALARGEKKSDSDT